MDYTRGEKEKKKKKKEKRNAGGHLHFLLLTGMLGIVIYFFI